MAKIKDKPASLNDAVSMAIKGNYDLEKFKKGKQLVGNIKFKEDKWIPLSPAIQDVLSIPGIPMGHITLLRGHSDTGKTTALLEAAVSAQKMGVLPVIIVTEMKWSWAHAREMGLQVEDIKDSSGESVDYKGFFIYADRSSLETVEDVAAFILDLLDEQKKGTLPFDLLFLWDSVGSVPCKLSIDSNKNNNEWNAGAMSQQFGNFVNQKILLSRKEGSSFTNTFVAINKVWVAKPSMPMEQPRLNNKGGNTMFFDASLIITFGKVVSPGTNKINATKDGKKIEFAKRTRISCDKNHVTNITSVGTVIMTSHGFIMDDKKAIDTYRKEHSDEWVKSLGSADFDIEIEQEESDNTNIFETDPD